MTLGCWVCPRVSNAVAVGAGVVNWTYTSYTTI
jgi:hypothetical protein